MCDKDGIDISRGISHCLTLDRLALENFSTGVECTRALECTWELECTRALTLEKC